MERSSIRWNKLPVSILTTIFSYLQCNDRINAAQVCTKWNSAFQCIQLWRHLICIFSGSPIFNDGSYLLCINSVGIAKYFPSKIKRLEIIWEAGIIGEHENSTLMLAEFFSILSSGSEVPQLQELILVGNEGQVQAEEEHVEELILALTHFLHFQTHLKLFYSDWRLMSIHGILLLAALNTHSSHSLRSLWLENYFSHQQIRCPNILNKYINRCSHLRELDLAYGNLSEETLLTVATHCRNTLIRLRITCEAEWLTRTSRVHSISSAVWKIVKEVVPKLKVNFFLGYCHWKHDIVKQLLVVGVPLSHFTIQMASPDNRIIDYLRLFSESLEQVAIDLVTEINFYNHMFANELDASLEATIISFIICCSKLKQLYLFGTFSLDTVAMICNLRSQNHIELKSFSGIFFYLMPEDQRRLLNIQKQYSDVDEFQLKLFPENSYGTNVNLFGNYVFEAIDANFFDEHYY